MLHLREGGEFLLVERVHEGEFLNIKMTESLQNKIPLKKLRVKPCHFQGVTAAWKLFFHVARGILEVIRYRKRKEGE